ncbi:N-acetyl-D-Glu racemase DgcA [Shewanella sp. YLB-07]|uniref:N-acetyl-D-Glu racemase DgcA n=1 Tax=Shewanella sp. YLB-07 TaxID=2601268 RepID=UPI00128BEED9|nr:N-acetyl-D-Glu racemase DgcA [Shewanella sp. YLB-07]MPY21700.1 dipeptide epimerase [Shewanella sp. YLB-07]
MSLNYKIHTQAWPLAKEFRISRGAKTQADVVVLMLTDGKHTAWAESVPYARYGETLASVVAQIEHIMPSVHSELTGGELLTIMPAGAARNVIDCALWDLKAKQAQTNVHTLLSLALKTELNTAQTLSLDAPDKMAKAAGELKTNPLIKIKLDADDILGKMQQIHHSAPNSQFIIDANEAWNIDILTDILPKLVPLNVALIEQPLPSEQDELLTGFKPAIPLCADESCHVAADLEHLQNKFQAVNIKLDKTGGLTEAVNLMQQAKQRGFIIMTGCMVGTSLAMAPAYLIGAYSSFVDLDGPLLLANDRADGFSFNRGCMSSASATLWGRADNKQMMEHLHLI